MQINKVEIKNFRNHTFCQVHFKSGINLLLGKNGSGKSSILEAIGLALFNAELRSSIKDAIKKGEKTSQINIEFTDNQGKTYTVERYIGSVAKHYLTNLEGNIRIENQNQVIQEIAKLSGIESNTKNIFQDVISAYQNKFTSIFAESNESRQKIFNRIFNTEIYRNIFDGFSKSAYDKYYIENETSKKELQKLTINLKDNITLKKELNDINSLLNNKEIELKKLKDNLDKLENKKAKLENIKHKIEINKSSLKNATDKIQISIAQLNKTKENIAQAEISTKVLKEKQSDYEDFIKLNEELKLITSEVKKLEKLETEKIEKEKIKAKYENELALSNNKIENFEKDIKEKQIELENKKQELNTLHNLLENLDNKIQDKSNQKKDLEQNFLIYEKKYKELNDIIKEIEKIQIQLAEKESSKLDINQIERDLNSLIPLKIELYQKEGEKKNIEQQISAIEERIRDNNSAYQTLSNGICPYLKEECENIKKGMGIREYFFSKKEFLQKELNILNNKLNEFESLDKNIKEINEKIIILEKTKKDSLLLLESIQDIKNKIELLHKDKQIKILEINEIARKFSDNIVELVISQKFELALDEIKNKISILYSELAEFNASSKELRKNYDTLKVNIANIENTIEENINHTKKLSEKKVLLLKYIDEIEKNIKDLNYKTSELTLKKEIRDSLSIKIDKLKPSYDQYLQNHTKANELPKYILEKKEIEKEICNLEIEKSNIELELKSLEENFSENTLIVVKQEIEKALLEYNRYIEQLAELRNLRINKEKEIEENNKLQEEITNLNRIINLLEYKIALTIEFRNNIKQMGRLVASRLLERIERQATDNYRLISGKSEFIRWINDDSVSYKVFLSSGSNTENQRAFEVLSGGEQVMVALAIRSAMASLLTKAQFAIFDEPTINLDDERKSALADSLHFMLNNLQQAIIVTHDDSFSNIANNIILINS